MTATARLLAPHCCLLGENPVWSAEKSSVFWLDTLKGQLHQQTPASCLHDSGQVVGGLVQHGDGWLFGEEQSLVFLDATGQKRCLQKLPLGVDEHINDACADLYGRLWLCTKHKDCKPGLGKVLRLDNRGCQLVLEGLTVPNGLGFSADHQKLYLVESSRREVRQYQFEVLTGNLGPGQPLLNFDQQPGFPDGLAVDSQNRLWIAHWAGSRVSCWDAQGQWLDSVELPVSKVTSLCFIGPELKSLCITTAQKDLSLDDLQQEPLAGSLFQLDLQVAGLPRSRAKLNFAFNI